jgi:hypothetical protein
MYHYSRRTQSKKFSFSQESGQFLPYLSFSVKWNTNELFLEEISRALLKAQWLLRASVGVFLFLH